MFGVVSVYTGEVVNDFTSCFEAPNRAVQVVWYLSSSINESVAEMLYFKTARMAALAMENLNVSASCSFIDESDDAGIWSQAVSRIRPADLYQTLSFSDTTLNSCINSNPEPIARFFWTQAGSASQLWNGCESYAPLAGEVACAFSQELTGKFAYSCFQNQNCGVNITDCVFDEKKERNGTAVALIVAGVLLIVIASGLHAWKCMKNKRSEEKKPILTYEKV